jgi:protein-arginine kinase activator protein McsA
LALLNKNKLKKNNIMSDSFKRLDEILRRIFENPDNFDFEKFEKIFTKKMLSNSFDSGIKLNVVYIKDDVFNDMNKKKLENELQEVIEQENFERAIEIRDELKKIEQKNERLKSLELELKESIDKQDFENCIIIRDEINKLKTK